MGNELKIQRIQVSLVPKLNLAFYFNSIPVLRELTVINDGEDPLHNIELQLFSEPPFIKSKTWRFDSIEPGQHYHIRELDVFLDGVLLGGLTEAETAFVHFSMVVNDKVIDNIDVPIELLARNQWGGISYMPELIAAFVTPNDPAIDKILKKTAELLRKHELNSALNGYAGGAKRVWEITSAIWTAIGSLGLDYSLPPASFEQTGQKIRNAGHILNAGIATCLDTTLLFCSALEQCGLNPLIVITHAHAFAGVWLKPEEFSSVVIDDITALRKREKLHELILFETTLITQHPCPKFSYAVEIGAKQISEQDEKNFEVAIDIRRARLQRIKPLATDTAVIKTIEADDTLNQENAEPFFDKSPDFPDDEIIISERPESFKTEDRLERWQRKLLDLSLRNSLLNFRSTKQAIKFEAPDPCQIEDLLADGQTLKLIPHPDLMTGADTRSQQIHESRTNENIRREHALDALKRKEVMITLSKNEIDLRLTDLYRTARLNMQEGGANTLFLALGFLSWKKDGKQDKSYRAPLILIPVVLERKSILSGFNLKLHDDEPRFNPTLLEMLRQDFFLELPIMQGELPTDNHGLDIAGIWKTVARAVKDISGWEVSEDVVLSTFSFAKYLMWKDLMERTDQLKQNPVVRHLIDTPRDPYDSGGKFPDPNKMDFEYGPEKIFCPLPSDSSQLSAVIAAANGKDFVLIGPPGTGKSQTIANLISQCIAEQKTVLFVSEKIAALNVVHRRLSDVGLGDFCLELHSNKARKTDVLRQLDKAWGAKGDIDADEWKKEAQRLRTLRDQLNKYVKQLHLKRRNKLSAFTAIGVIIFGKDIPQLHLSWPNSEFHNEDDLFELERLAEELEINAREVGEIANSHLSAISHTEWSPNWQNSLIKAANELILASELLEKKAFGFFEASGLSKVLLDGLRREGISDLSLVITEAAGQDWRFVFRPDVRAVCEGLQTGLRLLQEYRETIKQLSEPWEDGLVYKIRHALSQIELHREISNQLSVSYSSSIFETDVMQMKVDLEKAEESFWPVNRIRRRKVRKILAGATEEKKGIDLTGDIEKLVAMRGIEIDISSLDGFVNQVCCVWAGINTNSDDLLAALLFQSVLKTAAKGQININGDFEAIAAGRCGDGMASDLERMWSLIHVQKEIEKLDYLSEKTNGVWRGINTCPEDIEKALNFNESLARAISKIVSNTESLTIIKEQLERLLVYGNDLLEPSGIVSSLGIVYREAHQNFKSTFDYFTGLISVSPPETNISINDTPEIIIEVCRHIQKFESKLKSWCSWRKTRGKALLNGLLPLVDALEKGIIEIGRVKDSFKTNYARWWLNVLVDEDEVLRNFVSVEHEKNIIDFKALDDRFIQLTRDYVRAGLCTRIPDQNESAKTSEWGLLRREIQKKKMHLPLRDLIKRIPGVITNLSPCLLMSPLSIAQYLSADTALFDVVVFDEASQITVWDAIGAIARGKQVIMVGDPKQLPPTRFFDKSESSADFDDVDTELESILDECLGANIPTLNLSWHYRSRHESLIAFSNNRYYGGGLVTFPSPVTDDRAVSFHYVEDGLYEKGGARINKTEARALVSHIINRINDPVFKNEGKTIGVVTFNSEQQRLIEDLLDAERRTNPAIESYFADDDIEPIFVKNIENVQGDERDIMYFSITYGPDLAGVISMNFGPMNKDGGERRLNVAITRARHELLVFSSLKPEQVDLSRTQSIGVRDMKHFMEFAERGTKAIAEAIYGCIGDFESPFEQAVSEAISGKGWTVHPQIGVSSFRIDLGIVDPDAPGNYLAGIECDGATYHRSATARDRDKLREHVLKGLGWKILRIWSTDWWIDAAGSLKKIHENLENILAESRIKRAEINLKNEESKAQHLSDINRLEMNCNASSEVKSVKSASDNILPATRAELISRTAKMEDVLIQNDLSQTSPIISNIRIAAYQVYSDPVFVDPRICSIEEVAEGLVSIIEAEGPMLSKRAFDIYLRGCGIKRMGRDLKNIMNQALRYLIDKWQVDVEHEFGSHELDQVIVRMAGTPRIVLRKGGKRTFEEIPPSEVLVAAKLILKDQIYQKGSDEHLHAVLDVFDLKRLTTLTQSRLLEIMDNHFDYVEE